MKSLNYSVLTLVAFRVASGALLTESEAFDREVDVYDSDASFDKARLAETVKLLKETLGRLSRDINAMKMIPLMLE